MPHGKRGVCRHCDMVDFYRLEREDDLQKEVEQPMYFKKWLKTYKYEVEDD